MGSVYKNMQSYPNQKDQIYYGPHYYPGMEAVPTQMYVNPARPPMGYGCLPWGSNYGNASPLACHGCCNHSYLPAHCAWGSPYSHVPPHHCPGNYTSFPVHYLPPSPFCAMEQPRYEYEKNIPREHHCCGCPNPSLHQKEQKNIRIEEEEPQRERRNDDSVIPFQSKNSPYPIVWLPPDYIGCKERKASNMGDGKDGSRDVKVHEKDLPYPIMWLPPDCSSNKEQGKVESTGDKKDGSRDVKNENGKVCEQQPAFGNGWLPFDLNNLVSTNGKENYQQDDGKQNFPFPLFWMPYKPEEKESEKHKVKDANTTPGLESEKGFGGEKNIHVNRDRETVPDQTASKARDIPVKEGGQLVEKESSIKQDKEGDASVKDSRDNGVKLVDNGEKMSPKDGAKKKSPSPLKSSKLPPVCLRVDPLPRRKIGNGSSRSLSPPRNNLKPASQSNVNKEQAKILHNESKENKGIKNVEVVDGRTLQGKTMDVKIGTPVKLHMESHDDVSTNQAAEKPKEEPRSEDDAVIKGKSKDAGPAGGESEASSRPREMKADEVKICRRELSKEEAAVIIQSAYRGFDVCKWEPIKKLKQIAKVKEQIAHVKHLIQANVKHLIQAMKSSSDMQAQEKQRNIIAEIIMSLLLKLDTIQGLHPSVREVRKSVVRELVSLQEQLDSLMNEKLENSHGEEPMMTRGEDASNKSGDVISSQSDHETTPTEILEAHENQMDGGTNHENSEITEANLIGEKACKKMEKEAAVSSTNNVVDSAPEPTVKEEKRSNEDDNETTPTDLQAHLNQIDGGSIHDTSQGSEADQIVEEASQKIEKEVSESSTNKDVESAPVPAIEKDEKSNEVLANDDTVSKEEHKEGSEVSSMQNDSSDKASDVVATDSDMLGAELPVGVLDELCAQEGSNDLMVEVDASKGDEAKQLEEALVEPPFISEQHVTTDNKDSNQSLETQEVLDLPHNGKPEPVDSCNSHDKLGSEEAVDSKTGDATTEPDECIVQQPQNLIEEKIETRDMIGVQGAAEAKSDNNRNDSDNCTTQQGTIIEINNSEEASEENQSQVTEDSQPHVEESVDVPQQGEEFYPSGEVSEEKQPQIPEDSQTHMEVSVDLPLQGEECNTKLKESLEEQGLKDASAHEGDNVDPTSFQESAARDEVMESNRKLIEENERLREMMEKLIKSGQAQLTSISSLSGRVKDLEKKLSRKKKLKVKQYRAPRSVSSCMTKFDERMVGVAM